MESIKIIITAILLSILYGILHDLVTAHISIEYFTVGHPLIIKSESPVHMALLWGTIATWWVGLILGLLLTIAARVGKRPKLGVKELIKPMLKLLLIMAGFALVAGITAFLLAKNEVFHLVPYLADQIDSGRHHLFLTAGWSHGASYLVGFIGGLILCFALWRKRRKLSSL